MRPWPLALAIVGAAAPDCNPTHEAEVGRGRVVYDRMCAVCHGQNGEGYVADRAPALANATFLATASDDFLFRSVEHGRPGTTMSAWGSDVGGPLDASDVQDLVVFMRTWQLAPRAVLDESPLAGNPSRGQATYAQQCQDCHGNQGAGGKYEELANAEFLAEASNGFLRYTIEQGRDGTPMPEFHTLIDGTATDDLVSLLRSWQKAVSTVDAGVVPPFLGQVVLYPDGAEPVGFLAYPAYTPADVIHAALVAQERFGIVDARAPTDYAVEHIAGAVSVPFYAPEPFEPDLPTDAWLVCYCACPHAESSALAQKLLGAGFTKVAVLDEGFPVWKARGYPTRTGPSP